MVYPYNMVSTIAATLYIGLAWTSLDNPVILAVESFKVTSYKFQFSDETMFILPSYDFLLEFFGQLLQTNK